MVNGLKNPFRVQSDSYVLGLDELVWLQYDKPSVDNLFQVRQAARHTQGNTI